MKIYGNNSAAQRVGIWEYWDQNDEFQIHDYDKKFMHNNNNTLFNLILANIQEKYNELMNNKYALLLSAMIFIVAAIKFVNRLSN